MFVFPKEGKVKVARVIGMPNDVIKSVAYNSILINNKEIIDKSRMDYVLGDETGTLYTETLDNKTHDIFISNQEQSSFSWIPLYTQRGSSMHHDFITDEEIHIPNNDYLLLPDKRTNPYAYIVPREAIKDVVKYIWKTSRFFNE